MPIRIITVGKKHELWVSEGINRYCKRLKRPFQIEWVFLPHSANAGLAARQNESRAILSRLSTDDYVILLDERGQNVSSDVLSDLISRQLESSKQMAVIIGGAYGVDDSLRNRADFVWSLSDLVFPHQLVRLILIEQIYRTQEIHFGNPYHHE
ncbi:MAG: 23S rRNA (pseudouridine(1915)-N(3))-methyltransferase RlmH [Candidatus Saccharimonadaceae bacterium]|nr:23S rRNA (pseudouridine(1915)-N(3))-methyltransferase RlmH [Candidatus Saccharimonadaceae bacterium]